MHGSKHGGPTTGGGGASRAARRARSAGEKVFAKSRSSSTDKSSMERMIAGAWEVAIGTEPERTGGQNCLRNGCGQCMQNISQCLPKTSGTEASQQRPFLPSALRSRGFLRGGSQLNSMAAGSAEAWASPGGELAEETRPIQLRGRSTTERANMTEFTILQMHADRPGIRWHTAAGPLHDIAARVMQEMTPDAEAGGELQAFRALLRWNQGLLRRRQKVKGDPGCNPAGGSSGRGTAG